MAASAKNAKPKKPKKSKEKAPVTDEPAAVDDDDKPVVVATEDETPANTVPDTADADALSSIKKRESKKRRKLQKQLDAAKSASALALQHTNKKDPLKFEISKELAKAQTVIPSIDSDIMALIKTDPAHANDEYNPWNNPAPLRAFTLATSFANQRGNAVMLLEANSRRRSQRANHRHASG